MSVFEIFEIYILAKDAKHPPFPLDVTVSGVNVQPRLLENECKQDGGAQ